jgi:hypothetical protein
MEYSIHYLTDSPEKVIAQIKRREKVVITEHLQADEWRRAFRVVALEQGKDASAFAPQLPIEEHYVRIVVKKWDYMVSVFPIIETVWQQANLMWVGKIHRKKSSPTQQFGILHIMKTSDRLCLLQVGRLGKLITEEEIDILQKDYTAHPLTLRSLGCTTLRKAWLQNLPTQDDDMFYDFPLFLPDNWKKIWNITQETTLVINCQ